VLRVSLGVVFLVFASFKYVSGASPAEDLAVATVDKLTFGMVTATPPCCSPPSPRRSSASPC
jgi:hypothetical protein